MPFAPIRRAACLILLLTSSAFAALDPADLAPDSFAQSIAAREYEASPTPGGLQAPNRAHAWRTWFGESGVRLVERAADDEGIVELRLHGIGRAGAVEPIGPGEVESRGPWVEIRRESVVEWYVNSEEGLEQGFTLRTTPEGRGPVRVEVAVLGARAAPGLDGVTLAAPSGRRLSYAHLAVADADGRRLPSRFEVTTPDRIAIVFEDAGATYPVTVDPLISSTADAQLESNQAGAGLGVSVAGAGDVDGDGYADVIVGAPGFDGGESGEGAAFLFRGGPTGVASGGPLVAHATIESDQVDAALGTSVSGAGDVDGDGYADVIVGAPAYDAGESGEGAAFVYLGGAGGIAGGGPVAADATIESDQIGAGLGVSVAGAGDVNGDGYADIIVGAAGYLGGQIGEGAAFVFFGGVGGVPSGDPGTADEVVQGNQENAALGASVAGAGDVDADGYADVIVGAPGYDSGEPDEGGAFVFRGGPTGLAGFDPGSAATRLEADQSGARLGASVAGGGDVNGDGYADVIVGADLWDGGENDEGAAFLFVGGGTGVADGSPATAGATIESNQADAQLGAAVAGAGDVNGDGYADVVVGASLWDAGAGDEGAAFVFLGAATGLSGGDPSTALANLESTQADARLGSSVAGAGDVDGDGYSDVIVGAALWDAGESDEGSAFVYHGAAVGLPSGNLSTVDGWIPSGQYQAHFGLSVAGAGDVNGDGYDDIIVGAPLWDGGDFNEGAGFVFLGGAAGIVATGSGDAQARIESDQLNGHLGQRVAGAGDVNGDGYADIIIASNFLSGGVAGGGALVFHGSAAGIASGGPGAADTRLLSSQLASDFGEGIASAGDVNGDGFADIIIGAARFDSGESNEGVAFIYHGRASGIPDGGPATADTRLESNQPVAEFGFGVDGAGDVNGDGFADVIVGAQRYDAGEEDEGAAFVWLGGSGGIADGDPTTAATTLQANQAGAWFGYGVAGVGDVNGDGFADVAVGAFYWDGGDPDEGAVSVFHGGPSGIADGDPLTADARMEADLWYSNFGASVATAGDVNGDGFADMIVGSYAYTTGQLDEGSCFVFLGSPTGVVGVNPATAHSWIDGDFFLAYLGWTVASAGDVNGDGFADIVSGAHRYEVTEFEEGVCVVWHGNGDGRPVLAAQLGSGVGAPTVQPWGASDSDLFRVRLTATDPEGRGRAKLEVQACPAGSPFGGAGCVSHVSANWTDTGTGGVVLTETIGGLAPDTLYRWRARVLRAPYTVTEPGIVAPANPAHGAWRRVGAQAVDADIRTGGVAVSAPPSGSLPGAAAGLAIRRLHPNPTVGRVTVTFALPREEPARLELFDVAGRRVVHREIADRGAGVHSVQLVEDRSLPSGIYFLRLSQGRDAVTDKLVVVR